MTRNSIRTVRSGGLAALLRLGLILLMTCVLELLSLPAAAQSNVSEPGAWRPQQPPGISDGPSTGLVVAALAVLVVGGGYLAYRSVSNRGPTITLDLERPGFGPAAVETKVTRPVIVSNPGKRAQTIESVVARGQGFSVQDLPALPVSLSPGSRMRVMVVFQPVQSQRYSGELEVVASDGNGKRRSTPVKLEGRGTAARTTGAGTGN
jgi:hypothetical protein